MSKHAYEIRFDHEGIGRWVYGFTEEQALAAVHEYESYVAHAKVAQAIGLRIELVHIISSQDINRGQDDGKDSGIIQN